MIAMIGKFVNFIVRIALIFVALFAALAGLVALEQGLTEGLIFIAGGAIIMDWAHTIKHDGW